MMESKYEAKGGETPGGLLGDLAQTILNLRTLEHYELRIFKENDETLLEPNVEQMLWNAFTANISLYIKPYNCGRSDEMIQEIKKKQD